MKLLRFALGALSILAFAGCSKEQPKPMAFAARPIFVNVGEVTERSVPVYIETIGNVYANQVVELRPQIEGKLVETYISEGQHVKKGQLLYKIDTRPYEAALEKAKANLAKDEAQWQFSKKKQERYAELVKQDYVSVINYEQYTADEKSAHAQVLSGKAEVINAQINLDHCYLHAPIDGKVSTFPIDTGNLVVANNQTALTQIRQLSPVKVQFTITQFEFQEIQNILSKNGVEFEVLLPSEEKYPFKGTVYFVDNQVDQQTGTIVLIGRVPNEDERLWPGEYVTVRIFLHQDPHALVVPASAVQIGQKGKFVYTVKEDSTVENVYIKTGEKIDDYIVVLEGLQLGQKVVTDGQMNLYAGAKAIVKEDEGHQKQEAAR